MTAMKREEELTVSVKPLEWEDVVPRAETIVGIYSINRIGGEWNVRLNGSPYDLGREIDRGESSDFETALFEAKEAAWIDYEARIRSALLSTPKPEAVGWETDAEWDLEMRCANITENTPFAEVSKLINDLWQQYCLAAEPKPDAANARNLALEEAAKLIDQYMLCGVGADVLLPRGNSGNKVGFGYAAAIRALKAEGESRE
jgi:hypothetical protein